MSAHGVSVKTCEHVQWGISIPAEVLEVIILGLLNIAVLYRSHKYAMRIDRPFLHRSGEESLDLIKKFSSVEKVHQHRDTPTAPH